MLVSSITESIGRSSRPKVFYEKGVLRNSAKFTGKNLGQSLFFNKVADLRPATLLKKRLWYRCFPVSFAKFLGTTFFYRTPLVAASRMASTFFFIKQCFAPNKVGDVWGSNRDSFIPRNKKSFVWRNFGNKETWMFFTWGIQ